MKRKTHGGRLGTLTLTLLVAVGVAIGQPFTTSADDKLGETAIGAAIDELGGPEPEETEAPPAEETAPPAEQLADPAAATETQSAPETSAADTPPADSAGSGEPAPTTAESAATTDGSAQAQQAAPVDVAQATTDSISPQQQTATETTQAAGANAGQGNNVNQNDSPSLAAAAAANVLSGDAPLNELTLPVAGGLQQASGGDDDDNAASNDAGGAGANDVATGARPRTTFQAAGTAMQPSTIAPTRNRGDRAGSNTSDNGTVVVNSLSDAGDQGKVAVHGNIVAGTLCDGSQFWSLDGGGTVNANGVNLSANGGTALSDASAGDNNIAGGGGSAGNGGRANASADGGIVVVDELVTGNNTGNQVTVGGESFTGDCGQGVIDGGDATTVTNVNISADGGTALADASGGDNNVALGDDANAGNGGRANASADGGIVIVGSLILGNNEGNQINASGGGAGGGGCFIDGGTSRNRTMIDISADGGTAIADASGGDDNIALGDDANAGNGGRANANADGGLILTGDIITGNNQGNSISAECGGGTAGSGANGRVVVNGGSVLNQTNITLSADGGTAVADASGGDDNIAGGFGAGDATAGNGGRAEADASGGVIRVGNIVSGNNSGNVIAVGANFAPVPGRQPEPMRTISKKPSASAAQPKPASGRGTVQAAPAARSTQAVGKLPNTGAGPAAVAGATSAAWILVAGIGAVGVALAGQATRRRQLTRAAVLRTGAAR